MADTSIGSAGNVNINYLGNIKFGEKVYTAEEVDDLLRDVVDSNDERMDAIEGRLDSNDERMDDLEGRMSSVYRYRGSVPSYSELPSEGVEPGDVYNVEADSNDQHGMNYAWAEDSNDQGHWDPLGPSLEGYATKSYVDNGLAGKVSTSGGTISGDMDVTGDGYFSGSLVAAGAIVSENVPLASRSDATLTTSGWRYGPWAIDPATIFGCPIDLVYGNGEWSAVYAGSRESLGGYISPKAAPESVVELTWTEGVDAAANISATRTATPTAYRLGPDDPNDNPNYDKTLAAAGDYVLKSNLPAVVAPSTDAADAGKVADAKATGDQLAGKLDKIGGTLTGSLTLYEPNNGADLYFPSGAKAHLYFGSGLLDVDDLTGTVTVNGNPVATTANIPAVPSASSTNPLMDGVASAGSSDAYARGDHVHPADTSRASVADATLNGRGVNGSGFSEWTVVSVNVHHHDLVVGPGQTGWELYGRVWDRQGVVKGALDSTYISWSASGGEAAVDVEASRDTPNDDWEVSPSGYRLLLGDGGWYPCAVGPEEQLGPGKGSPDSLALYWAATEVVGGGSVTATRTALPGYVLGPADGPNDDKPLASADALAALEARVAALEAALGSN